MEIGIRGHDLGVLGVSGIAGEMNRLGIKTLQLVCYKSIAGVPYSAGGMDVQMAAETARVLSDSGIRTALLGAYFNPVHPDAAKARLGAEVFLRYLSLSQALNTDMVASETGSYNGDKWTYHPHNRTPEARAEVARTFRSLCDAAKTHNAYVGIEGAAGHVCHSVSALKEVIALIDRDNIRVVFDLFNFLDKGNASEYLNILQEGLSTFGGAIRCFHIKDCDFTKDGPVQRPVGKGQMDFIKILGFIKRHDPEAVLILEGTTGADIEYAVGYLSDAWDSV